MAAPPAGVLDPTCLEVRPGMKHALNRTVTAVDPVNGSVSVDQADASQAGVGPRRPHKARQDLWWALLCLVLMVGRGGVEPPTFRFSGAARGPVVVPGRPSCLLRQPRPSVVVHCRPLLLPSALPSALPSDRRAAGRAPSISDFAVTSGPVQGSWRGLCRRPRSCG